MKKALIGLVCALGVLAAAGAAAYVFFPGGIVKSAIALGRFAEGLTRREIQVDDHRWVYNEGGKGDVILFIHGYGDSKEGWADFPAAFIGNHRVIIPDLPGFGENSRVQSDTYAIPEQVKRLDRFVESIGVSSFHLCGVSMGGAISAYYAGEHPEKVKSLLLIDPFGVVTAQPSVGWLEYQKDNTKLLCWKNESDYHRIMGWAFDRPPKLPKIFQDYVIDLGRTHYDFNKKIFNELLAGGRAILENRLGRIQAPTLILWGRNDRVFHVSCAEVFRRGIPKSRLEILDAGHVVYIDAPRKAKALYKDFLAGLK